MTKLQLIEEAKKEFEKKWKFKGYAISDGFHEAWLFHEFQLSKAIDETAKVLRVKRKRMPQEPNPFTAEEIFSWNEAVTEQESKRKQFMRE